MISGAPIVEVFGGMGGLRQACELLGLQPQGLVYFDTSDLGTKLVRRQCGYVLTFGDIRKVTFEDGLATLFPKSDQGDLWRRLAWASCSNASLLLAKLGWDRWVPGCHGPAT